MAYYTGTATDHADLFTKLRAHATLEGWACSFSTPHHIFENDGLKVSLEENITGTGSITLGTRIESTISGTHNLGILAQYTLVQNSRWRKSDPVVSYHAFINGGATPSIHLAAEILPSIWRHFTFGILNKIGSWQGGAYIFTVTAEKASEWSNGANGCLGVMSALDNRDGVCSYTNDDPLLVWGRTILSTSYNAGDGKVWSTGFDLTYSLSSVAGATLVTRQPNADTGESLVVPVGLFFSRLGGKMSLGGAIDNVALTNVKYLLDAQEIVMGADTWMFFPVRANGFVADTGLSEESGYLGFAYKK